ncbi:pentatricopeptide repeat-containing protein At1g04840 [Brassica rapa]|uniref:pentatricopeptide repeat-containing protein At1g04840 n=1 Tax=Brassica campestris TaxID=3711 RepID=UPI00142D9153|nr:pentatricopeptide repeat-containing protein At1g04840 [Brassica rapa]
MFVLMFFEGTMKSLCVLFKPKSSSPAKISFPTNLQSSPDESHFISLIHSCKDTVSLRRVYAQILRRSFLTSRVASQLLSCSSLLKSPDYTLSIFRYSKEKNLFTFNALIRGLTENARFECSIRHFILMLRLGVRPDRLTFPFALKSNSKLGFRWLGKALHAATVKDCVDCDSFVRVSLVDMYAKTKGLKYAYQVFDESPERIKKESVLLWNVLINGYCRAKDLQTAETLFGSMPERNSGSWSTLIKGYVDIGELNRAKQCFELMPEKNVLSWTTLINGFSQNGEYETAISIYFNMVEKGCMKPNEYTVAAVLSACSKSGALESGIRVHGYVLDNGFKLDRAIGTALVDMYAKCGEVDCAANVFSNMGVKDILSWTAMIQGWAIHGRFQQAILCFREMMYSGEKPDEVVFLAVLTACLNSGEVDLGINFFDSMRLDYMIEPTLKHYVVVVDLLGRAGKLNEAHELIESMPINPDLTTWAALYRACKAHNSNRKGEMVSQNLVEIDPELRGSYIFLDKRYAATKGKHRDVEKRRKIVKERGKGWSYIEVDGQLNKFVAGDNSHKQAQEIRLKLEEIVSLAVESGYIPGGDWSIHDIEEEEKENVTGIHSEKLALALGLLRTSPGTVIRIVKNLRICGDCHSLMKYVSKISQRDILLRDARQFHHFKEGSCSCGDYW